MTAAETPCGTGSRHSANFAAVVMKQQVQRWMLEDLPHLEHAILLRTEMFANGNTQGMCTHAASFTSLAGYLDAVMHFLGLAPLVAVPTSGRNEAHPLHSWHAANQPHGRTRRTYRGDLNHIEFRAELAYAWLPSLREV